MAEKPIPQVGEVWSHSNHPSRNAVSIIVDIIYSGPPMDAPITIVYDWYPYGMYTSVYRAHRNKRRDLVDFWANYNPPPEADFTIDT